MSDLVLILFCLTMIANVIALVRHWRMLRVMQIVLNNLIDSQKQFDSLVANEQRESKTNGKTRGMQ
jgi:hypothetical protein